MSDITNITNPVNQTFDAQQLIEVYESPEEKINPPEVNVDADYEASKAYSTGVSAKTAAEMTSPQLEVPTPKEVKLTTEPTGNPDDFLSMAREVGHNSAAGGNVSDDLVKKALEKGQPAQ